MELTVTSVDYAPSELHAQVPFAIELLKEITGDDRPDYWLGCARPPLKWLDDNIERTITHLVVATRWEGTRIEPGVDNLPIGIAYVTDASLLRDARLDFAKARYVAIGLATETGSGNKPKKLERILAGTIGRAFGRGKTAE